MVDEPRAALLRQQQDWSCAVRTACQKDLRETRGDGDRSRAAVVSAFLSRRKFRSMEVESIIRDAVENAQLYHHISFHPRILSQIEQLPANEIAKFHETLDQSFFNVFNQYIGYFMMKRHCMGSDDYAKLTFLEDVTAYRTVDDNERRKRRCVPYMALHHSTASSRSFAAHKQLSAFMKE